MADLVARQGTGDELGGCTGDVHGNAQVASRPTAVRDVV